MTSLAIAETNGALTPLEPMTKPVRDRIRQAREYRKKFEQEWQLNLAFAAGKHWVSWHDKTRTLRSIQEINPAYRGKELISEDVITEYRMTALGELGSDNDRPNLLLRRQDVASEDFQEQLNLAVGYGWQHEWDADNVLAQIDRFLVDLGTAAIRCRWDKTSGDVLADNVPHLDGKPVLDPQMAMSLMANGPNPRVQMGPVKAGKICWDPLSSFHMLVPPGATHEREFSWEAVVRPAYLPDVRERYPDTTQDLREDRDISTGLGITTTGASLVPSTFAVTDAAASRLRDHVWLFDYYERPTQRYPKGRVFTLAGNDMKLLDYQEQLPYQKPDASWCSGITYFHWWRVTGRFFSRGLVDVIRQGQFVLNKRRTQVNEIIDRSMPYVIVQADSKAKRRQGSINEMVEVEANERAPQIVPGSGPGSWMQADVESIREGLVHSSGISGPRRGENPSNVTTYSQLALINELDTAKREPIYLDRKRGIASALEDSIYDMRTYWGPQKQIALAGDDSMLEASIFNATQTPTFFIVEIGTGQAKPRSQAAELQKVTDIWNAAVVSTAAGAAPGPWVRWFKESIQAGEPLDLPAEDVEDPAKKAEYENHFMEQGVPMPIAYYDIHAVHLPKHRFAQDQAMFAQNMQLWQIIEQHCQLHMQAAAAQAAQQMAQMQQQVGPGGGGQGPGPPGPPRQNAPNQPMQRPPQQSSGQ